MAVFGHLRGICLAIVVLLLFCTLAAANVEKAVFVASSASSLLDLDLDAHNSLPRLTPDPHSNAWRTFLPAAFSWSTGYPGHATTWLRLDGLVPGQRYELRVCWAATQPTEFLVDVYDAAEVWATPQLQAELAAASTPLPAPGSASPPPSPPQPHPPTFARIVATADYITAPMSPDVAPVLADIILDPFVLNIVPRSLLPTIVAILAVAAASAVLARRIVLPQLRQVVLADKKTQ